MSTSSFIRKLQTMDVFTPYRDLLKTEFGFSVSAGVPQYQIEYLYKYMLNGSANGIKEEDLYNYASEKSESLFLKYPWIADKYNTVSNDDESEKRVRIDKSEVPDGSILFNPKTEKYELFIGNMVTVRCATVDKVKRFAQKRLNFTTFI